MKTKGQISRLSALVLAVVILGMLPGAAGGAAERRARCLTKATESSKKG